MSLASEIAKSLGQGKEKKNQEGWITCCPAHPDKNPSLAIKDIINKKGEVDVLVKCHSGCDWQEIKKKLTELGFLPQWNGQAVKETVLSNPDPDYPDPDYPDPDYPDPAPHTPPAPEKKPPEKKPPEKRSFVWKQATSDEESIQKIKEYFKTRKIFFSDDFPFPPALRWNSYKDKKTGEQVEMIAAAVTTLKDKAVMSVQRLFISTSDEWGYSKKGAKMLGETAGRGVWFYRKEPMKELIVGEGIETTLSAMAATGKNGVSALSTSGMGTIALPDDCEKVWVLVDSDTSFGGQKAALKLAERLKDKKDVRLVTPCDSCFTDAPKKRDFNDLAKNIILQRFDAAVCDVEWSVPDGGGDGGDEDGYYPPDTLRELNLMNRKFAAVLLGDKFRVVRESYNNAVKKHSINFLERGAFDNYFANKKLFVNVGNEKKAIPAGKLWMEYPDRTTYENVVFEPGGDIDNKTYNLFRGFPLTPKKGDWGLMRQHIEKIICDDDPELYRYVMAWMARMIQDPGGERPGVALVMCGGKGIGKGFFVNWLGKIFGEAFMPINSVEGFTGKFTVYLSKCILAFLDECAWGGNKKSEAKLSGLITEPMMLFEPKGIDSIFLQNNCNVIMASNEPWTVPASWDERRYCVLTINESRKKDFPYFKRIKEQMVRGGIEAMFFDLLNYDYSDVELRDAPRTAGLKLQIEQTFEPIQAFWHDILSRGYLLTDFSGKEAMTSFRGDDDFANDEPGYWPKQVWKSEVYNEFLSFIKTHGDRFRKANEVHFWRKTYKTVLEKENWVFFQKRGRLAIFMAGIDEMKKSFEKLNGGVDFDLISVLEDFKGQF
ncbi:MAG: toprim domain-containing protein [Thermodesulfobacteriota bacterium]|nr:toprim domain-containing protein [Thermodesulfobacteriota bacterium]